MTSETRGALPPIVCTIDEGYVTPLLALIESLSFAHGDGVHDLRLIVIHGELGEADRRRIEAGADRAGLRAELRPAARLRAVYRVDRWASAAVYMRLMLPEVIPDERHVLYLDADVLALRDLRPLLRTDLSGLAVAAVRDPQNPTVGDGLALPRCDEIGVKRGQAFFSSGVMLFDLVEAVRQGLFERAHEFLSRYPQHALFWDQDALNVAAEDAWVRLDRRWNTIALSPFAHLPHFSHAAGEQVTSLVDLLADEYTAAVLHFAGPIKPWNPNYPPVPLRQLYHRFLAPSR